ncbi:hypothetical protein [Tsukamurella paurometabola]|uniref:Uncharacterized protein n=1 Tax=Tsukamurella paurometabola TaxID=2061 RepID=A0A3P8LE25_TSUPA|nr:hypothetical protein [Tsukamurella paurometabola]UEA81616.1 hypothetical protein LK411_14550 [Tsukamurella paurometabola]VDR38622.1 Uncharacterised protein [Tsukamurella paurometabola]
MYFTVDAAAAAVHAGDVHSWADASCRLGRNDLPDLLLRIAGDVRRWGEFPAALADAWCGPDSPTDALPAEVWIDWLQQTGYLLNGASAPRPTQAVTVYRGGRDARRMSWTPHRATAELFASGLGGRFPAGKLWTATAPAQSQLMTFDGSAYRVGEVELVVDPALLADVREVR